MPKQLVFFCLLLFFVSSLSLSALQFEGELQTNLINSKTLYEEYYSELDFTQNFSLFTKSLLLNINNTFTSYDSLLTKPGISTNAEIYKPFKFINTAVFANFNNKSKDELDYSALGIKLFYDKNNFKSIFEIGLLGNNFNYYGSKNFSHYNLATYFLYKHFLKSFSLNLEWQLSTRNFYDSKNANYNMLNITLNNYLSLPLKSNLGLQAGFFINQNFNNETSCLLYKFTELYDKFAFNNYELYSGLSFKTKKFLLKPKITFALKHYLEIATNTPYDEYKGFIELHTNYKLSKKFDILASIFLELANSDNNFENAHVISLGCKYKF